MVETHDFVDEDTEASLPGNLPVSPLRYARHYPRWPVLLGLLMVASLAFCWYGLTHLWNRYLVVFPPIFVFFINRWYWRSRREHFWHGCANPAVLLETGPDLWATSTDLSNEDDAPDYPVIKIVRGSLRGHTPQLSIHDRFPVVALYEDGDISQRWVDFDPRPAGFVTGRAVAIERLTQRISESEWENLAAGLRKVPRPYQPGLYPV